MSEGQGADHRTPWAPAHSGQSASPSKNVKWPSPASTSSRWKNLRPHPAHGPVAFLTTRTAAMCLHSPPLASLHEQYGVGTMCTVNVAAPEQLGTL